MHDEPPLSSDSGAEVAQLLEFAIRLRAVDEAALALAQTGRVAYYLPLAGREGIFAGLAHALRPGDWVFAAAQVPDGGAIDWASHRGVRWVAGASPSAARLAHATGAAWAARLRQERAIAATVFGPAAEESADYHVALNFAGVYAAPALFVCATPETVSAEAVRHQGEAYGIAAELVDGDDALAVRAAAEAAAQRGRAGRGPTLLVAAYGHRDPLDVARRSASRAVGDEAWQALWSAARQSAAAEARRAVAPASSDAYTLEAFAAQAPAPLD